MEEKNPPPGLMLGGLHEDILVSILSYVADVPFEISEKNRPPFDARSTLTHVLPLVSKQFHRICRSYSVYWKQALLRLMKKDPLLWKEGVRRVHFEAQCNLLRSAHGGGGGGKRAKVALQDAENQQCAVSDEVLLQRGCEAVETRSSSRQGSDCPASTHLALYRSVLERHMRYQGPVFYMHSSVRLGSQYGLHFFEPRYRLLIAEVLSPFPTSARRGDRIEPHVEGLSLSALTSNNARQLQQINDLFNHNQRLLQSHYLPTFIHAHQSPLQRGAPACIVQVKHCIIQPDGSADVLLEPTSYIWVERVWERPGTGGLYEASGIRMSKEQCKRYERWSGMRGFGMGDGRGWSQMLPIP